MYVFWRSFPELVAGRLAKDSLLSTPLLQMKNSFHQHTCACTAVFDSDEFSSIWVLNLHDNNAFIKVKTTALTSPCLPPTLCLFKILWDLVFRQVWFTEH